MSVAADIGRKSGRDVWFPYYPLCDAETSVKAAFEMVYEVYQRMLLEYEPQNIAILGFSSGAALSLGVCMHNNAQENPASFMETIRAIMEKGEELPEYMISGVKGDFSKFPMTHFYYGSDEVLYAEAEYFARAFKNYGARYEMHVGEGMFHCYPMMPYFPEAKEAYNEIVDCQDFRLYNSVRKS